MNNVTWERSLKNRVKKINWDIITLIYHYNLNAGGKAKHDLNCLLNSIGIVSISKIEKNKLWG